MPYIIKKAKGGYYVQNGRTGRRYSRRPIPLKRAKAQRRAIGFFSRR